MLLYKLCIFTSLFNPIISILRTSCCYCFSSPLYTEPLRSRRTSSTSPNEVPGMYTVVSHEPSFFIHQITLIVSPMYPHLSTRINSFSPRETTLQDGKELSAFCRQGQCQSSSRSSGFTTRCDAKAHALNRYFTGRHRRLL